MIGTCDINYDNIILIGLCVLIFYESFLVPLFGRKYIYVSYIYRVPYLILKRQNEHTLTMVIIITLKLRHHRSFTH